MTRVMNDPKLFAEQALSGYAAANARYVTRVHGGVVRSTASPASEVSLVVGGGSGHYPAFAGWVGPSMAHGAVCGNVFASPSASQVYSVVRAADNGAGVVLSFGNYAGDVLHFGQAAEKLRAEGVDVRVVTISDDIASNTPDKHRDRRGIAGDVVVVKVIGAACAAGMDLDAVEKVAVRINDRTRSFGVAFGGCTLPGADHPLFSVPEASMGIGLGIHGEPGVREEPMRTASGLADLLVDGILAEEPERGVDGYEGRVAVVVNGLGTVKYEELFVVFDSVARRLVAAGLTPVLPEVGEFVTSLDMAGLSLTLAFLDSELEELWLAPVDTPAYRRGGVSDQTPRTPVSQEPARAVIEPGSPESQQQARRMADVLRLIRDMVIDKEAEWGDLDAIAGDGDHGQGMRLGGVGAAAAADAALEELAGARTMFVQAGAQWAESAGGTSGALWGAALTALGGSLSDDIVTAPEGIVAAVEAAGGAILRLGGAKVGDKTMVDAIVPFLETLRSSFDADGDLARAWSRASDAAAAAAQSTAGITASKGRARVLGDKSLGTPDPGATSFAALQRAIAEHLGQSAE